MEKKKACPIYIGVAGWSYPDWKGIVYTDTRVDQLEYVSKYVDCVEINNTYYRPPAEHTSEMWLRKTETKPSFFFTAKLNRDFTHEGRIDPEIVRQFHKGFDPMLKEGKLKQLLAQFKYDFEDNESSRKHMEGIVKNFNDAFNLVVEVRHKSWQSPEALEFLQKLGVALCNLDYPLSSQSFNMPLCTVGRNGYFRMHGRNVKNWFSKSGRDETYNYYYNQQELNQIKERIEKLAEAFEYLTVIANNHYRAAELANAIELKALITEDKQPVPHGLLKTYTDLEKIASKG